MCVNLQSLYDLPNPTVCNLKSVLVLTNALGRNLISVLGLTNPLGRRLISALVLTSHLKCQAILLILLCLAAPFFNSPRLFLLSIYSTYTCTLTPLALSLCSLANQTLELDRGTHQDMYVCMIDPTTLHNTVDANYTKYWPIWLGFPHNALHFT